MNNQPRIPDPETAKRLLANLRQTHLEMHEFNLELEALTAQVEADIQQQKLRRMGRSLKGIDIREHGSGSTGAIALAVDILKGAQDLVPLQNNH